MSDSRTSLLTLTPRERQKVLAKQAKEMSAHYSATREERISRQGGRIYDYDSDESVGEEGGP